MTTAAAPDKAGAGAWFPGFLALALIWGSSFLLIEVAIGELHPTYVALGRAVAGSVTILAVLFATRRRLPRGWRVWGHFAVAGAVQVTIPFTLFGYGEQRISSLLAGIWNATTPLIVLPMAVLVFRTERWTARRVGGILLGFAGVLVVLGVWRGVGGSELTGQLMCLGAAASYGVAIPYQRRFFAGVPAAGIAVPAGLLVMGTAQLAVLAPLVAGAPPALSSLSPEVVASVLALGALGTGLAFVLNFRVIKVAGASTSASVTYLLPVVATILGVLVLDEHLTWYQPVGALVVLAGVAVSQGVLRLPGRARPTPPAGPPPASTPPAGPPPAAAPAAGPPPPAAAEGTPPRAAPEPASAS